MASWFDKLRDKAVAAGMSSDKSSKPSTPRPEPDAERVAANQRELDALRQAQDHLSSLPKAPEPKAESPQEQQLRQMLEESHKNPETPEQAAEWKLINYVPDEFPAEWNLTPEQAATLRKDGIVDTPGGTRQTNWHMEKQRQLYEQHEDHGIGAMLEQALYDGFSPEQKREIQDRKAAFLEATGMTEKEAERKRSNEAWRKSMQENY